MSAFPRDALVSRWTSQRYEEHLDAPMISLTREEFEAADRRVGDLLEPGEWIDHAWFSARGFRLGFWSGPGVHNSRLIARYMSTVPNRLGGCDAFVASGQRFGRCLLPRDHPSWPDGVKDLVDDGHRIYLFSPRDSAAMLAGMRARLTEPMEDDL